MTSMPLSPPRFHPSMIWLQFRRIGPLGLIILLHVVLLYALQSGLLRQAAEATLPKEVFVSFITPEPQPELPKAQPKTVPIVQKSVTPLPAVPVVNTTPSEKAITVALPAPAPIAAAEQAATAPVSAPPAPPAPPAQIKTISSGVEYLQPPQPV